MVVQTRERERHRWVGARAQTQFVHPRLDEFGSKLAELLVRPDGGDFVQFRQSAEVRHDVGLDVALDLRLRGLELGLTRRQHEALSEP